MMLSSSSAITTISFCILLAACGGGGGSDNQTSGSDTSGTPSSTGNSSAGGDNTGSGNTGSGGTSSNGEAGNGTTPPSSDGTDTPGAGYTYDSSARFNTPTQIQADQNRNLYVLEQTTDTYQDPRNVRRIAADGNVSTLSGTYADDSAIALDSNGNLYVKSGRTIHKFLPDGEQTVTLDFDSAPYMAVDSQGNVYLIKRDIVNNVYRFTTIMRIAPSGQLSVFYSDPATYVRYIGLATGPDDNLYSIGLVSSTETRTLIQFSPQGEATSRPLNLASDQPNTLTGIPTIANLDVDASGNVYIATYHEHIPSPGGCIGNPSPGSLSCSFHESAMSIIKIAPDGKQSTIRRGPPGSSGETSDIAYDADFGASHVAAGPDGNLYATYEDNQTVYKITQSGEATLYAGKPLEAGTSD